MSLGLNNSIDYNTENSTIPIARPWTVWRAALAVFLGNLMTAVLAAIILAFVKG